MRSQILMEALAKDDDWQIDTYTALHIPSGISFWIANGAFFFDRHNGISLLGLFQRHRLWRHFKKMVERKIEKRLQGDSK